MEVDKASRKEILSDKIQGIIFGGALGDAVGLATEFMNKETAKILYRYGPIKFGNADGHEFWRDGHRRRWNENDFTDDTDQLLLILQCLLSTNGHLIPEHFAFRLKEWTDIGFPELGNKMCCGVGYTVGSVICHPEFLADPHKASFEVWNSLKRDMAANGAVMRTAVLGIPSFYDEHLVVSNAIKAAKVTHADPRCIFSSVVVSVLIARILKREMKIDTRAEMDKINEDAIRSLQFKGFSFDKNKNDSKPEDVDRGNADPKLLELCTPKSKLEEQPPGFFKSLLEKAGFGKSSDNKWPPGWPNHKDTDSSRLKNPVNCIDKPGRFETTDYGTDIANMELIKEVISDYKFLLHDTEGNATVHWHDVVDKHCFPESLQELQLDEQKSIGYTLKCLGSALYCFGRKESDNKSTKKNQGQFFMNVITELALEAGDADTNCAVAGALLGARLGMKGLPKVWVDGVRNREFLMDISNQLVELVWNQFPTETVRVTR